MEHTMTIPRVHYAEKQILRAADLTGEQAYRMDQRRRHVLAAHGWGIAIGLMLYQPDEKGFWLQPGLAVDGYGREIRVTRPLPYSWGSLDIPKIGTAQEGAIDVWLLYAERPLVTPQGGSYPCGPGEHNRWDEGFTLELEVGLASSEHVNPWQPPGVITADLDFAAWEDLPGGPARRWPVYLGRIAIAPQVFKVEPVPRPYISLFGESVTAPSGKARMEIGAEQGGGWRFAISLLDPETGMLEDDRLVLDSFGHNTLRGRVVLQQTQEQVDRTKKADLTLKARKDLEGGYSSGFTFETPVEEPIQAMPWRMYHTQAKQPEQPGQPPPPPVEQLRMELFHPEDRGNPALSELVIGATEPVPGVTQEEKFVPHLRVGADGSVTIYGDLTVMGSLTQGPVQADPTDPRFVKAVLDGLGRGSSATQLDPTLAIRISAKDAVKDTPWVYEFEIENTGPADLTSVVIRVDIILPNRVASETLPAMPIFKAGETTAVMRRQIIPRVEGQLLIRVTAIGFGPQMRSMFKYEEQKYKISPPPAESPGATDSGNVS
jgi:hypothetical protein